MFASPQQYRGSFDASACDMYSLYELMCALGVPTPSVFFFSYCSGVYCERYSGTEERLAHSSEVELFVLSFGAFLRAVRVRPVKRLSFSPLLDGCNGQCVLMKVPDAMVMEWFDFDFSWLIDRLDVDPTLVFIVAASLSRFDQCALGPHDLFLYKYENGMLPLVCLLGTIVWRLAGHD